MRVSDVITYVTKQNERPGLVLLYVKRWRNKNKKFRQIKIILIPTCSLQSKKMHTNTW